jgi:hypothetical protein
MTFDLTAIVIALLSVVTSVILGFLQFGKWRAEAKKANTEANTDLVRAALEINKQEMQTLRDVIQVQKDIISEKDSLLGEREKTIEYLRTQHKEDRDDAKGKESQA